MVSPLTPSGQIKILLSGMEAFACSSNSLFRLRKDFLPETIVAEIKVDGKKGFIVLSYRHPNMSNDELTRHMSLLENIYESIRKEDPIVFILWGDFNARSPLF